MSWHEWWSQQQSSKGMQTAGKLLVYRVVYRSVTLMSSLFVSALVEKPFTDFHVPQYP